MGRITAIKPFVEPEVGAVSDNLASEEKPLFFGFLCLFERAWHVFVHDPIDYENRQKHTRETLSNLRESFIREFNAQIEMGITFRGLYPGFADILTRNSKDEYGDYMWANALRKMRNGLASGDLPFSDRLEFFDVFFRKSFSPGKDGSYLGIPECMGADMFEILNYHIHVGPLRQPPFRDLDEATLLERKEWEPWASLIRNESLRKEVSDSLAALGVEYEIIKGNQETRTSFPVTNLQESKSTKEILRFRARNGKVATSHLDLGFGVSTILPLVVALHSECALLTIEQPELHIHPRLQTELGDLLIKQALGTRHDRSEPTVLVETHSEHLILRLLRRIRETQEKDFDDWPEALKSACPNGIRPQDVAVLYVEPGEEGAQVSELPITADGDFTNPWPGGFFSERSKELF